jgi:Ras family
VFDISSSDSFAKAREWVKELLRQGNPGMIMSLAGNKADLAETREVRSCDRAGRIWQLACGEFWQGVELVVGAPASRICAGASTPVPIMLFAVCCRCRQTTRRRTQMRMGWCTGRRPRRPMPMCPSSLTTLPSGALLLQEGARKHARPSFAVLLAAASSVSHALEMQQHTHLVDKCRAVCCCQALCTSSFRVPS